MPEKKNAVAIARAATQEYVLNASKQGNLSAIAKDERQCAIDLANKSLFEYVTQGYIKLSMIERWVAEAVATLAQPQIHPVLNGELIYTRWAQIHSHSILDWQDPALPESVKKAYEKLAVLLMGDLGLCFICGAHPDPFDVLVEVNRIKVCVDCQPWLRKMSGGDDE